MLSLFLLFHLSCFVCLFVFKNACRPNWQISLVAFKKQNKTLNKSLLLLDWRIHFPHQGLEINETVGMSCWKIICWTQQPQTPPRDIDHLGQWRRNGKLVVKEQKVQEIEIKFIRCLVLEGRGGSKSSTCYSIKAPSLSCMCDPPWAHWPSSSFWRICIFPAGTSLLYTGFILSVFAN